MEAGGSEGESKLPPEVENKSKRKMKTASQLELLEKTFSADPYPPEHVRAELSVQLGLSDRQLQMWFCHRRLKDRKGVSTKKSSKDSPVPELASAMNGEEMMAVEAGNEHSLGSSLGEHSFMNPRQVVSRSGVALARIGSDVPQSKRYFEPQQSSAQQGAIAFVEGQLGEPLRDDGPILGMVFDPLPPGAFGTPIAGVYQQPFGQSFEAKPFDLPNGEVIKGAPRALHEYQFLPEQPTVRNDTFERVVPSYQYGSPAHVPNTRTLSLSTGHTFNRSVELVPAGYGFSGHLARLSVFPQQGRQVQRLTSSLEGHANIPQINSFPNIDMDAHLGAQQLNTLDNCLERGILPEDDVSRVERKRKSEEARIAQEVEAHEKRIRKELEKQDILKRKREEQIKKEMEKHNREIRKEEERLQREKQREEERYLREQRRELDRKEKFLQKESIRAERMRQKEEVRREKEEARQKAANERAIVRRMAKESVELIDDERLELMELAALSNGFPSIFSLDLETLQNLDAFREELTSFPPKTVQLKRPFSVQPWHDSELSIGNLLMVWRFLIAFTDALGLWPFTLDEFIQAFHDYDPRLLGEVHVCLLRCIIKDIEDVARTPSTGLVVNQTSSISPGGGHPQIVEGAYAWGFSIRSWQCHLNPLTWPEILRQFALSAGFGPQLKKTRKTTNLCNDNEDNNDKDIISNLRSGATVKKAVAIMQQRGSSNLRKSRHCLTPGTVKYAAFQILALEGSMGLTIMEVAEKIQISGLRDLTTSKTPEASIAAALSRDAKLFERTAPSTYCVRPAYRKDPADADTALSAARERIRAYKSALEDVEDADAVERDEDSRSDDAEDPNVDDLNSYLSPKKDTLDSHETNQFEPKTPFTNGKKTDEFLITSYSSPKNANEVLPPAYPKSLDEVKGLATAGEQPVDVAVSNVQTILDENMNIDERNFGEPWVQGLMEGEYSNLSVEERINALVALIGIVNEGNSIRVVLEERLESANALKKQMWAEVQLDKRRMKEDYAVKMQYPSTVGIKTDPQFEMSLAQARQSPFAIVDKMSPENAIQQVRLDEQQNEMSFYDSMPSEKHLQIQDLSIGPDNPQFQQFHAAEKSSSRLKSLISHKAEEMCVHRSLPLGQDRRRNRYWQFTTSASCNDPGCGIIFVELHQGHWRIIDSEEDFNILLASLDVRGIRECHLYNMLQKIEASFKETIRKNMPHAKTEGQIKETREAVEMSTGGISVVGSNIDSPLSTLCSTDTDNLETSTSFSIELGRNENEKNNALKRYQDLEEWMWEECYAFPLLGAVKYGKTRVLPLLSVCMNCREVYCSEESCCPCCKSSGSFRGVVEFSKDMALVEEQLNANSPNQIRLLKVQLALIEASILVEALQPLWTKDSRKLWGTKLYSASSAEELLQALTMLEQAINGDYLSHKFETTSELLSLCKLSESGSNNSSLTGVVHVLPWLPQTTASVALRLMEFDSSISYTLHQKMESLDDERADSSMPPSRSAFTTKTSYSAQLLQEENVSTGAVGFSGSCRGRGRHVRGRGRGKSQRKLLGSKSDNGKRRKRGYNGHMPCWRQESCGKGGCRRGPCATKDQQKQVKMVAGPLIQKGDTCENLQAALFANEWNEAGLSRLLVENGQDASISGRSDYDDENNRPSGDEYDYYAADKYACNGNSGDVLGGSEENVDMYDCGDKGNKDEAEYSEDEQSHLNVEAYLNVDTDDYEEEPMVDKDGEWDRDPDDTESSSSDFSQ